MMEEKTEMFSDLIEDARRKKQRISLCLLAVAAIVVSYLFMQILFGVTVVEGNSMYPEIPDGSIVIFNRLEDAWKAEDIVIAETPEGTLIKRIKSIEDGRVFLIGDNREASVDSRIFGSIQMDNLKGKAICVIRFLE